MRYAARAISCARTSASPSTRCARTSCARALTILGVVIGVATVMTMAAIVKGIRDQILTTIEHRRPDDVLRDEGVLAARRSTPTSCRTYVRDPPRPARRGGRAHRAAPEIGYAGIWAQIQARISYNGARTRDVIGVRRRRPVSGDFGRRARSRGAGSPQAELRERRAGRRAAGAACAQVFGRVASDWRRPCRSAAGRSQVIGLYQEPGEHLRAAGTGDRRDRAVPVHPARSTTSTRRTRCSSSSSRARASPSREAEDAVTIALREMRRLRPADKNTFDLISQDQILDVFNDHHGRLLPRDARAGVGGADGRRHRRDGDHDGLGHRAAPARSGSARRSARRGATSSCSSSSRPRRSPASAALIGIVVRARRGRGGDDAAERAGRRPAPADAASRSAFRWGSASCSGCSRRGERRGSTRSRRCRHE